MTWTAIGALELDSVAAGFACLDVMLKAAEVTLVQGGTICPGKFFVFVAGDLGDVEASVTAGRQEGGMFVVDSFVIPRVHEAIAKALAGTTEVGEIEALGSVETFTVCACIRAADAAVKAASVQLVEIRRATGLGGKAYFHVAGEVSAVRTAVNAAVQEIKGDGTVAHKVVIPQAHPGMIKAVL